MTGASATGLAELHEAVERFIALSECALRGCEARDTDAISAALDARELVGARVGVLSTHFAQHQAARRAGRPTPAPVEPQLRALRLRTRDAERLNGELAARVAEVREEIRGQISRLTHDEAGMAGYANAMPRASRLDLRR